MKPKLYDQSIAIILKGQGESGGYLASPDFKPYRYCWFRDGSYIAYAMDLVNECESAARFHRWAIDTILKHREKLETCIKKTSAGLKPLKIDYFHCRFLLNGDETPGNWGNHQLDGLGVWLWSYSQHMILNKIKQVPDADKEILLLIRDYLAALWRFPCYDCWEENRNEIHTYTLAAIYAGLNQLAALLNDEKSRILSENVKVYIFENLVHDGYLCKSRGQDEVDGNLISIATPFCLLDVNDPILNRTISKINEDLCPNTTGLHRYGNDEYYGGGIWILLTAWLGWHYSEAGFSQPAAAILKWIESQATEEGELSEQICTDLLHPEAYSRWKEKWGEPAIPLLWSQAMYLILYKSLESKGAL